MCRSIMNPVEAREGRFTELGFSLSGPALNAVRVPVSWTTPGTGAQCQGRAQASPGSNGNAVSWAKPCMADRVRLARGMHGVP